MPRIPTYTRKESVPGVGGNVPMNNSGVAAAREMGNAVQGFTNEFADLVTRQAEDLRQRDIAIENADITNKATKYYLEQKDAYEQGIAKANSISEVTDLSKQYNDSLGNNLRQSIGVDNIKHPEVRTHAEEIIGRVSNQFLDHSSVTLSKVRSSFADKAVGESVANALNIVRSGGSPEDAIQTVEENIKSLHNTGSIDLDKATDMTVKAQQQVIGDYMEYLSVNDPKQYVEVVKSGKYKNIMSSAEYKQTQEKAKSLNDAEQETDALDTVIKESTKDGFVDYNVAVSTVLSPKFIKDNSLTINQAQNIASSLGALDKAQSQQVIDETNKILVPLALQRNGLNRQSDLTPAQWSKLERVAPEYSAKLQDSIRRERDYQERANRADASDRRRESREIERDRKQTLAENETSIMLDDDFMTRNLDSDLATGYISRAEYNRLKKAQKDLNPVNRDSVKEALKQINSGTTMKSAVKEKDASQLAIWRMKYGELVKTWAANNAKEPNFDVKLQEFMEKHVLNPLVTDIFMNREEERRQKYFNARAAAGATTTPKQNEKTYSQADLEFTAKKHNMTVDQVKQKLRIK